MILKRKLLLPLSTCLVFFACQSRSYNKDAAKVNLTIDPVGNLGQFILTGDLHGDAAKYADSTYKKEPLKYHVYRKKPNGEKIDGRRVDVEIGRQVQLIPGHYCVVSEVPAQELGRNLGQTEDCIDDTVASAQVMVEAGKLTTYKLAIVVPRMDPKYMQVDFGLKPAHCLNEIVAKENSVYLLAIRNMYYGMGFQNPTTGKCHFAGGNYDFTTRLFHGSRWDQIYSPSWDHRRSIALKISDLPSTYPLFQKALKARLKYTHKAELEEFDIPLAPEANFKFLPSPFYKELSIGEPGNDKLANLKEGELINFVNVNINTFLPDAKEQGKVVIQALEKYKWTAEAPDVRKDFEYVSVFKENLIPPFSVLLAGKKKYKFLFLKQDAKGEFIKVGEKEVVIP